MSLDLEKIVAIDVHVHVHADQHGHLALDDELNAAYYCRGDMGPKFQAERPRWRPDATP